MTDTRLLERARRLGIDIADTNSMIDALERNANSLEAARHQISNIVDEVRMQTTLSRERVKWLTQELDKLQDLMRRSSPPSGATA
jgi:chromosome segregation ATPase